MTPADAAARSRALDLSRHIIAVAPAGSGKTGLLVQRFLAALATVEEPEQVVAITFTNKAAAEIRERIGTLLQRAASGAQANHDHDARSLKLAHAVLARDRERGWELASNPGRLQASTIDGFNNRIAAELPLLSGLGGHTQITDDEQSLYERALTELFDAALKNGGDPALTAAATTWLRSADNRIDRLLPPLVALLRRRDQWVSAIVNQDWDDDAVLDAMHRDYQQLFRTTLGDAAAAELLAIARAASAHHETMAWAAALTQWPAYGAEDAEIHRRLAQLVITQKGLLRKPGGIDAKTGFPANTPPRAQLQAFVAAHAGDEALATSAHALQSLPPARFPQQLLALRDDLRVLLHHALAHLQLAMAATGTTDFSEIAARALHALRPDGAYGDALLVRDRRIRHLLVDEMQDTSEAQVRLLEQLTQGWEDGDGHSLFLVGDPQQSIYAFRNARVTLFMKLWSAHRLGELTLTPVQLTVNFRSTPALIAWFNETFTACFPPRDDLYSGEVAYTPAKSIQPATTRGGDCDTAAHAFTDAAQEAEAVAERAARLVSGGATSIAILARARSHLPAILAGLRARHIPYACQDIDALQAVPAVRDVLALAHALWHPEDRLHWAILLRAPWVGLSWADLVALSANRRKQPWPQRLRETPGAALSEEGRLRVTRLLAAVDAVAADRECPPLAERVERVWLQLGGPACGDGGALADTRRTLQLLRRHAPGNGFTNLRAFERAVGELYASPADGAVQLMTIHKAKGLEFDHVLLVGCGHKPRSEQKPLLHFVETPHGPLLVPKPPEHWGEDQNSAATQLFEYAHRLHKATRASESLRLLYVAATRARVSLHLYATLTVHDDGTFAPTTGTFAHTLWQSRFRTAFEHLEMPQVTAPPPPAEPPRAPRLAVDFRVPEEDTVFVPREQRTLRPSERVLSVQQTQRQDEREDDLYARLVGTLYHHSMQRLIERGRDAWQAEQERHAASLASGFRRLGLPEPQVDSAVARVLELVGRTLQGEAGQWLLETRPSAHAEYTLSGYVDGEWVAAAIDLCFEADGALWIIDYKTTGVPLAAGAVPGYIDACRHHYAPQLRDYARLLALHKDTGQPIRTALYLAEPARLVELDTAHT